MKHPKDKANQMLTGIADGIGSFLIWYAVGNAALFVLVIIALEALL